MLQGVNLSGMDWAKPGIRVNQSSRPNINFGVPRANDLAYLASQGLGMHRYCILWEMVQPILLGSPANATVLAAYGISAAGQLSPRFMGYILDALDSAAAAGCKLLIDLHNYCRYRDYLYQADGSVIGFQAGDATTLPFTASGSSQVIDKVMALVSDPKGITQSQFNNFWTNFANYVEAGTGRAVKTHAGLGAYGLMNEPHDMPASGSATEGGFPEDLSIWNTFAQGAVTAIRGVDASTPIYVAGNNFEIGWTGNPGGSYIGNNPSYPLTGTNITYETHFYLDSHSSGALFDWATEAAFPASAGESSTHGATVLTGQVRAQYAVDFKNATGKPIAATETGMPVNDPNWQASMQNAASLVFTNGIGMFAWLGGNFWASQDFPLSAIPNFKQGKTFMPLVHGLFHKAAARTLFDIYADADTNWGPAGTVCTVTLYTRGYSPNPLVVTLTKAGTGTLSAGTATIPAGANQSTSFTYTTAGAEDATVTFSGQTVNPGVRHFYSMDPVTFAATDQTVAGRACLAKYKALEWLGKNAFTDYVNGAAATAGQNVRGVWNSGYGENYYNAHGMKIWWIPSYDGSNIPTLQVDANSAKYFNFSNFGIGLWSRKSKVDELGAGTEAHPQLLQPYNATDPHFQICAINIPAVPPDGAVFAANDEQGAARSQIGIAGGAANMLVTGSNGATSTVSSPTQLTLNTFHTLAMKFAVGSQQLRVDTVQVASMAASPPAQPFTSMSIGWLFNNFFPFTGFGGRIYGAITGKGTPTDGEMQVLEQYLAVQCNTTIGSGTGGGGGGGDFPAGVAALTDWTDPSTLSTMTQSVSSGGAVTGAGQQVGIINSRAPGTINWTVPDSNAGTLQQDVRGGFFIAGPTMQASGGGGSTTAFYICCALKLTFPFGTPSNARYVFSDHDTLNPNNGYDLYYDVSLDRMVFSQGTGAGRVFATDTTVLNGGAGVEFFVNAWDDGVNLNIQVNNGLIITQGRGTTAAGNAQPTIWEEDTSQSAFNLGNLYGMMWAKNSSLTAPNRAGIKTWLGAKAGLTL